MQIVFFNGPPRSGKDTFGIKLADHLLRNNKWIRVFKFARPLKDMVHTMLGIDGHPSNYYEEMKEQFFPEYGMTLRQLYIWMSEEVVKPKFGQDVWGKALREDVKRFSKQKAENKVAIVTDSGFYEEAEPVIKEFGAENCLMIQMERGGCDFKASGDSRSYVDLTDLGVNTLRIHNGEFDKTLEGVIHSYNLFNQKEKKDG